MPDGEYARGVHFCAVCGEEVYIEGPRLDSHKGAGESIHWNDAGCVLLILFTLRCFQQMRLHYEIEEIEIVMDMVCDSLAMRRVEDSRLSRMSRLHSGHRGCALGEQRMKRHYSNHSSIHLP